MRPLLRKKANVPEGRRSQDKEDDYEYETEIAQNNKTTSRLSASPSERNGFAICFAVRCYMSLANSKFPDLEPFPRGV